MLVLFLAVVSLASLSLSATSIPSMQGCYVEMPVWQKRMMNN